MERAWLMTFRLRMRAEVGCHQNQPGLNRGVVKGEAILKKAFIFVLVCMLTVFVADGSSQTRRRSPARRAATATKAAAEKTAADLKTGAAQVAAQIKTLT